MENIGVSVGEWTSNDFQNFTSMNKPLDCDSLVVSSRQNCSISFSEDSARKQLNGLLSRTYGLSTLQIKTYWNRFKKDVQKTFDRRLFQEYALQEFRKEGGGRQNQNPRGDFRDRKETRSNTDTNGNPTSGENGGRSSGDGSTKRDTNTPSNSILTESANSDSNTKYYIYGGIGLVVILGAFLIFKK